MSSDEKSGGAGVSRTLRHKERQRYLDDEGLTPTLDDADGGEGPGFSLEEKLASDAYNADLVKVIKTNELNLKYLQKNGFHTPLLFHNKEGLGLKVPASDFSVNDVKHLVGAKRLVDVVDVQTQKGIEMPMKDFVKYYQEKPSDRKQLLNVISLEFSKTKMEPLVQAPTLVRQIDWVESVWPRDLKDNHSDSTNNIKTMKYPKVQKYVLMSVEKCYTDFHIDFGGTSVWYHVLRGKKIFWLIPSTAENFELYIDWTLSGNQDKMFFGDIVAQCQRVTLKAGDTFMIPTGWIHAVYTPEDSLVFGGNFLHSYNMTKQLQVAAIEDNTRVPEKFRYPLFHEMHWYVLERYVSVLTENKSFLVADPAPVLGDAAAVTAASSSLSTPSMAPSTSSTTNSNSVISDTNSPPKKLLTSHEMEGLEQLILFLEHSSPASKVPHKIRNSVGLLKAGKQLLSAHRNDDPLKAVTGFPILSPLSGSQPSTQEPQQPPLSFPTPKQVGPQECRDSDAPSTGGSVSRQPMLNSNGNQVVQLPPASQETRTFKPTLSNLVAPPGATIVPAPPRPSTTASSTPKPTIDGQEALVKSVSTPSRPTPFSATTTTPLATSSSSSFAPTSVSSRVGPGLKDNTPRPFVATVNPRHTPIHDSVPAVQNPSEVSRTLADAQSRVSAPAIVPTSSDRLPTPNGAPVASTTNLKPAQVPCATTRPMVNSPMASASSQLYATQQPLPPSSVDGHATVSVGTRQQPQQEQTWKEERDVQQQMLKQNYPNTSFSTRAPSPSSSSTVMIPAPSLTHDRQTADSVPSLQQQHQQQPLQHNASQLHQPQFALQVAPQLPQERVPCAPGVGAVVGAQQFQHSAAVQQQNQPPHISNPTSLIGAQPPLLQQQQQQSYAPLPHPSHPIAYPVTTFIQSFDQIPHLQQQQQLYHQRPPPSALIAAGATVSSAGGIPVAVMPQRQPSSTQQNHLQQLPPTLSPQPMVSVPISSMVGLQPQYQSSHSGTASPCPLGGVGPSRVGGGETPPTINSDQASMPRSDESPMDVYDPSKPADKSMSKRSASARRRRTRCRRCLACTRSDCGDCVYCKDMKKFGGPGRMKQSCLSRQCMAPVLPHTAVCMICGDDERIAPDGTILLSGVHAPPGSEADSKTTLMECGICWEILHPKCLFAKLRIDPAAYSHLSEGGNINQELPNSWECPKCCLQGKGGSLKPRILKQGGRGRSSSGSRASSPSGSTIGTPVTGNNGGGVGSALQIPYSSTATGGKGPSVPAPHTTNTAAGFYPIDGDAALSQDALQQLQHLQHQQQLQQRLVREVRSSTPPSEDEDESEIEDGPTLLTSQQQLPPRQSSVSPQHGTGHLPDRRDGTSYTQMADTLIGHSSSHGTNGVAPPTLQALANGGSNVERSGSFVDIPMAPDAADAGDSSATEEGDGGERIMMMVASEKSDMASNGSGVDGGGGAFVERSDGLISLGAASSMSGQKKKVKKRKVDETGDSPPGGSAASPRKRIKIPSGTPSGVSATPLAMAGGRDGVTPVELAARLARSGAADDGSDNESESESEGEMNGPGGDGGRGGGASSGGNSSDSDTGENSKDALSRGTPHMQNGGKGGASGGAATAGGAEDQSFGQGGNNVALTPKQIKKQLKGKLKSMTRLERAKWLKRAKKELVKRFGGSFDGDADSEKVKVEPETEDDAGRRNEDAGDDVFELRGSKTLADLRVAVEKYIVRPWEENRDEHGEDDPTSSPSSQRRNSDDAIWFNVFRHFTRKELCRCSLVSRSWFKWANDQRLWKECAIRNRRIKGAYLVGLVRRQPESLDLSWTDLSAKQLLWLLQRLPRLKSLRLAGLSQSTVEALGTTSTPLLRKLSLAEADSVTDAIVRDIIGPPADYRPGIFETKSRMRYLTSLSFKGCNISDVTLRFMTVHLKFVETLDLSYCTLISDDGLDALTGNEGAAFHDSLQQILLVGLPKITGQALTHLSRCSSLVEIDLTNCSSMTEEACRLFISFNVHMPLILVPESKFLIRANNSFLPVREEHSLAS